MSIFLDTHIFLYAAGAPHPLRDPCAKVLRRVADGTLETTVNTEVLQEILYVLTRRGRGRDAPTLARHVASLFPDLLPVVREDMLTACNLLQQYPRLPVRDAIHAATMLRNGLKTIVSVDSDFDQIPQIQRLTPSAV